MCGICVIRACMVINANSISSIRDGISRMIMDYSSFNDRKFDRIVASTTIIYSEINLRRNIIIEGSTTVAKRSEIAVLRQRSTITKPSSSAEKLHTCWQSFPETANGYRKWVNFDVSCRNMKFSVFPSDINMTIRNNGLYQPHVVHTKL